jgi:hypothetical protein
VATAGLLPIMQSGVGPESSANRTPSFEDPEFRGVIEEPLTIDEIITRLEARGESPPKIFLVNSQSDYLSLRASLARTGASGTGERAIPANVRMYDIAGASHVTVMEAPRQCKLHPAILDWTPVSRALLVRLDVWVASNSEPPPSRLMPLEPATNDPTVLRAPAHLPNAIVQRPRRDADGNSLGGVRLPDLAVPLGAHAAQNQPLSPNCMLIGAYLPFAHTKAEREAAKDSRLSLAERYRHRDDYVNRIRVAARELEQAGFLLREDAAIIMQSAAASPAFKNASDH